MTQHRGDTITRLVDAGERLRGVQLPLIEELPLAYRARTLNGYVIVCNRHLDLLRAGATAVTLTGESLPAEACDYCILTEEGSL